MKGDKLKVCYKKLWKLLVDKNLKKTSLIKTANLSSAIIAKLGKNENVSMATLIKICECLDCDIGDIVSLMK